MNGSNIVKINYRAENGLAPVEIFNAGGLKLTAGCAASTPSLSATTTTDNGYIRTGVNTLGSVTAVNDGTITSYDEADDFDAATPFDMVDGSNIPAGTLSDSTQGTFTYAAAGGAVITGTFLVEDDLNGLGGTSDCIVIGTAVVAG